MLILFKMCLQDFYKIKSNINIVARNEIQICIFSAWMYSGWKIDHICTR